MYFKFFKLHSRGKRSADNRRRFIQSFPKSLLHQHPWHGILPQGEK